MILCHMILMSLNKNVKLNDKNVPDKQKMFFVYFFIFTYFLKYILECKKEQSNVFIIKQKRRT